MKMKEARLEIQTLVQHLIHENPEMVQIIYECPCHVEKKELHHWNYFEPYQVMKLCRSCHAIEHGRLKKIADGRLKPKKTNHDTSQSQEAS